MASSAYSLRSVARRRLVRSIIPWTLWSRTVMRMIMSQHIGANAVHVVISAGHCQASMVLCTRLISLRFGVGHQLVRHGGRRILPAVHRAKWLVAESRTSSATGFRRYSAVMSATSLPFALRAIAVVISLVVEAISQNNPQSPWRHPLIARCPVVEASVGWDLIHMLRLASAVPPVVHGIIIITSSAGCRPGGLPGLTERQSCFISS